MKFLPLLALLISPFVSALTRDDLQQRFTEQPVIRAHFDQTRTIKRSAAAAAISGSDVDRPRPGVIVGSNLTVPHATITGR